MLKRVDAKEAPKDRELRVLKLWTENDVFKQSEQSREGGPEFVFYDGPPTANGQPHPGHVLTRVMKDVYPRYRTMKGYHVERKAGWDTHGLPVEIEIEKKHGISGKKQIQAFGIDKFIEECRNSVLTYEQTWRMMSERLGYWVDMDSPYMTLSDNYIESVWTLLKTIFDKGYLYQGHRVSPYCPHCETTLSSHEVAQGYKDVKDLTVTAKFRVLDGAGLGDGDHADTATYILAWTTTPWTLPSNVALAVNPNLEYSVFYRPSTNEKYWVATALLANHMADGDTVIGQAFGRDIIGSSYAPVFPYVTAEGPKHRVIPSDHVTPESGTGVVHMAPAFGEEDYRACRAAGIVFCNFVDETGRFTADVSDFSGRFVRDEDVNVDIVKYLAERGTLFEKHRHEHSYPHCWRCDTPLLYYAIDSWFIQTTAVKQQMIENSQAVNWMPEHIKEGRFGNFLENLIDWNLSRSRYWGTPLPVWICDACEKQHCVGSKAELLTLAGTLPPELHKPYIDDISWACDCGGTMRRVSEVIDAWFDSGSMPFAQLHYPFENKEAFERLYPADFICEAIDQTRGWFYSLLAISTLVTGKAPYQNVLVLGHVLDEAGKKMSKSKKNYIEPFEAIDTHGADGLRFYFLSNTQPWNSQRFYHKAVAESKSKFIDILQNVHAFYALYASIDAFNPTAKSIPVAERPLLDRWMMARLHDTIARVDAFIAKYDATAAARQLQALVDDVSTWYVRRNRDRFWATGMEQDKVAAYLTLHQVLTTLSKLIAPLTPFIAEELYQNLVRSYHPEAPVSVHLCDYPVADETLIDITLLAEMDDVMHVVETGRSLRNESKMKTRQPLSALYAPLAKSAVLAKFTDIISDELNVKEVIFCELTDVAKPGLHLNLKELGKVFGKLVPVINAAAKAASTVQIADFEQHGQVELEGHIVDRTMAELRYQPSFTGVIATTPRGFVGLNTELNDALVEEGYVREIISKMQMMRKEVNYDVMQKVTFAVHGDVEVLQVLDRNRSAIADTALVKEFVNGPLAGDLTKDWDINGKPLTLTVKG